MDSIRMDELLLDQNKDLKVIDTRVENDNMTENNAIPRMEHDKTLENVQNNKFLNIKAAIPVTPLRPVSKLVVFPKQYILDKSSSHVVNPIIKLPKSLPNPAPLVLSPQRKLILLKRIKDKLEHISKNNSLDLKLLIPKLNKKTRILISSTQYPGYGGAATNAYYLIEFLLSQGYRVCGVFIHDNFKVNFNPKGLPGIYHMNYQDLGTQHNQRLIHKIKKELGGKPHYSLCKNVVAPLMIHEMFPKSNIIYLVSGSLHANLLAEKNISSQKLLTMKHFKYHTKSIQKEKLCLEISSRVVFNSPLTQQIFEVVYPKWSSRNPDRIIYNTSMYAGTSKSRSHMSRTYDIAYISSRLDRHIKNFSFFKKIINNIKFSNLKILIIGCNSKNINNLGLLNKNTTILPLQNHEQILNYLQKCKVVCLPSLFDSSPNLLKEATDSGCHCLMSKNVGNWEKYPSSWICNDVYDVSEWTHKLETLLALW